PSATVKSENEIPLKQAFSLHSKLVHVKRISQGQSISYGGTYIAEKDEWIGTVPIGYGDGWTRKLQGFHVLVDGKYMPIVGSMCMIMMMVRIDKNYEVGKEGPLIGEQKGSRISRDVVPNYLGTMKYEILCLIEKR